MPKPTAIFQHKSTRKAPLYVVIAGAGLIVAILVIAFLFNYRPWAAPSDLAPELADNKTSPAKASEPKASKPQATKQTPPNSIPLPHTTKPVTMPMPARPVLVIDTDSKKIQFGTLPEKQQQQLREIASDIELGTFDRMKKLQGSGISKIVLDNLNLFDREPTRAWLLGWIDHQGIWKAWVRDEVDMPVKKEEASKLWFLGMKPEEVWWTVSAYKRYKDKGAKILTKEEADLLQIHRHLVGID